jgi:hypothetical protein
MYLHKIDRNKAFALEDQGDILLVDVSGNQLPAIDSDKGQVWKDNFERLQAKAQHISPDKILDFYSAKYVVELPSHNIDNNPQFSWRYLYGIENKQIKSRVADNVEYVYILVNAGYPDLIKIGMTKGTVEGRTNGINTAGTLYEWEPKYALPLKKGKAFSVETQMHKYFDHCRVSSDKGSSREFFKVGSLTALDKLRDIGSLFQIGDVVEF